MARKLHLLGAPFRFPDQDEMIHALEQRFNSDMEKAFSYGVDIGNRQINKAIGLLTFNSILFAAYNVSNKTTLIPIPFAQLLSLLSCLPLLYMMFVVWFPAENYKTAEADFSQLMDVIFKRSHFLSLSLYIAFISLSCAILNTIHKIV